MKKPKSPLPARSPLRKKTVGASHRSLPKRRCWECLISKTMHKHGRCAFHSSPWSKKTWKINPDAKPAHCIYLDKFGNPVIKYVGYEKKGGLRGKHYNISQAHGIDCRKVPSRREMRVYGAE